MLVLSFVMLAALLLALVVLGFVAYEQGHRPPGAPERMVTAIDRVASTVRGALDEPGAAGAGRPRPSGPAGGVSPLGQHVRRARHFVQDRWARVQEHEDLPAPVRIDRTQERRTAAAGRPLRHEPARHPRPVVARHGADRRP